MKIECSSEKIKNILIGLDRITGKNLSLPVLRCVLCVASGKSLKFRATNLSVGVEIEIPAEVEKDGVTAFKGAVLAQALSSITKDEKIKISLSGDVLNVVTSKSVFSIKTENYEDFPTLPVISGEKITIPVKKLIEGIKSVFFSASISDIKPEISSVYIYPEEENLIFVSTDSFRLAEKKIKMKQNEEFKPTIIPVKNVIEIVRILENESGDTVVTFSKNQISFVAGMTYITSRIIDGVFPDYKQIIPKEKKTEAIILKQDFINILKGLNIFSDKFNQIIFHIHPVKKLFEIFSKNSDVGENKSHLDGALTGDEIEVSFNYKYINDAFPSLNTDSISVSCVEKNKPVILRSVGDQSFMYLIMPMNR